MDAKGPKRERVDESGSKVTQAIAIGGIVIMAIADQAVEPKIDIPKEIYVSLFAISIGATKPVKRFIEYFFRGRQ